MKQKWKIALVAMGVLVLAGCGNQNQAQKQNQEGKNDSANMNQEKEQNKSMNGVISSIKDAVASGKVMRCTYRIQNQERNRNGETEMEAVAWVNGEKYKTEMTVAGKKQYAVFDKEAMYSWGEGQKQGMKMTTACSEELAKNAPKSDDNAPQAPDPNGEKNFENAMDVKCEEATNADFSIPSDVTFSDQCEMMKNLMKNVPNGANAPKGMPDNLPAGMPQL